MVVGEVLGVIIQGNQKEPKNFSPVALTSHFAKVQGKLAHDELVKFLQLTRQLIPEQHGFISLKKVDNQSISSTDGKHSGKTR